MGDVLFTIWILDGALALLLLAWVTAAASEFRSSTRRRWLSASLFAIGYALCVAGSVTHEAISRQTTGFVQSLKNPGPPFHLELDWGKDFPPEKRSEYSRMLARHSFEAWGMRTKYFDLQGALRVYEPTQDDLDERSARLHLIQQTERMETLSNYNGIAWLFLPLAGIGISLTPLWSKVKAFSVALDRALGKSKRP